MATSEDSVLCPMGHRELGSTLWDEHELQDKSRQDHQHGQHTSDALQKEQLSVQRRTEQRGAKPGLGRGVQPTSGGCNRHKPPWAPRQQRCPSWRQVGTGFFCGPGTRVLLPECPLAPSAHPSWKAAVDLPVWTCWAADPWDAVSHMTRGSLCLKAGAPPQLGTWVSKRDGW